MMMVYITRNVRKVKMDVENSIASRIKDQTGNLTRAERQLANTILENYPVSGLGSITTLSKRSQVSNPTIVRMAKKLGFAGFPQMQEKLRSEVEATISNPIIRHERLAEHFPDTHLINRFADSTMENLRKTLAQIDPDLFDKVALLLSETNRHIYLVGGRITHPVADYLFTHLQMIRDNLTLIPPNANTWPHYALSMKKDDVLIVFDIRRYEREVTRLANTVQSIGLEIVLFTDQWGSPISKLTDNTFRSQIEVPSASDSNLVTMFFAEAIIAAVQNETWDRSEQRMKTLETLFDNSKLFNKFV
jgi:DNA-binding MurR/RpiR family transcriptional regulator